MQKMRAKDSILAASLVMATMLGCGSQDQSAYVPADELAHSTLTAVLDAWKAGGQPGRLDSVSPPVQVVDSRWSSGARLRGYEIVRGIPGEGPKQFEVKLSLDQADVPENAVYVVVGQDPLWVFLGSDYQRLGGM